MTGVLRVDISHQSREKNGRRKKRGSRWPSQREAVGDKGLCKKR